MKPLSIVCSLVLLLTLACKDEKKQTEELEVETVELQHTDKHKAAPTTATFSDAKVEAVFNEYIAVKTALVNSNPVTTQNAAIGLMTALANVGVDEEVLMAAQKISEATEVEAQRTEFVAVTAAVEQLLEGALTDGVIYKQYCPMAFDFEGAYWLSNSKEINNPYFGDQMLRCGKVDSEIK